MLTSANNASNQYIRPDYLSPLPTTVGRNNKCKTIFSKLIYYRFHQQLYALKFVRFVFVYASEQTGISALARSHSSQRGILPVAHTCGTTTIQI